VVRHGEAPSSYKDAAEKFVEKFKDFVDREGFIPEELLHCDETRLFWKKNAKKDLYHKRWPSVLLYHVFINNIYK